MTQWTRISYNESVSYLLQPRQQPLLPALPSSHLALLGLPHHQQPLSRLSCHLLLRRSFVTHKLHALTRYSSVHYTTNAAGQTQLVTVVLTQSVVDATESAHAATASATSTSAAKESKFPTGGIIGICVGVGAAILALIALAVWRMKRRGRNEDEAIRW